MVSPASSSLSAIKEEARNYLGISSASILPDSTLEEEINYFYTANIPESIKMDQLRDVYVFYTIPYCDRYPVNVNQYQSFREPIYVDGLKASFYKDRGLFHGYWPNVRTYVQPAFGDGSTTSFNFTLGGTPIVRTTFMASVPSITGSQLICADSPNLQSTQGTLLFVIRDSEGDMTPPFPDTSPLPSDPLPAVPFNNQIGQINYETGVVNIEWPSAPAANEPIRVNYYNPAFGRPNSVLFYNNEFIIRPVPKFSHKVEIESYKTPVEFMQNSDVPFLLNFKNYIALGVSISLLSRIGDTARRNELIPEFEAAEGRVLERQANEEIGQANATIFNQQQPFYPQYPYGGYWY